jgi:aldehyde oxidoreductase
VQGNAVTTLEGLPSREREIYSWAFGVVGAVQCGFCMPQVVISAKSLLDKNPTPTFAEIKNGLRYNLCRCTGYLKIERAIQLAAQAFRDGKTPSAEGGTAKVGARMIRVDSEEKLLGTGAFVDDMKVPGMLYGAVLRAKYPRALVKKIDISAALACPGVEIVLTDRKGCSR